MKYDSSFADYIAGESLVMIVISQFSTRSRLVINSAIPICLDLDILCRFTHVISMDTSNHAVVFVLGVYYVGIAPV